MHNLFKAALALGATGMLAACSGGLPTDLARKPPAVAANDGIALTPSADGGGFLGGGNRTATTKALVDSVRNADGGGAMGGGN